MDRSALPVRACLTRRNGCAAPPSTMQKISCDMRSVMRGGSADKKEACCTYVGLWAVGQYGDEDASVETMGYAVCTKCGRECSGSFQESMRLRHCGEKE